MRALTPPIGAAVAVVLALGCGRDRPPEDARSEEYETARPVDPAPADDPSARANADGTMTEADDTGAAPAQTAPGGTSASQAIAESRCEREMRCGNIGADEEYPSMNECITRVRADWKEDLNARECPGGIDREQLRECLEEVRNEDCGNPVDTLGRIAACTTGQICERMAG